MNKPVRIAILAGIFGLIFLAIITSSVKKPEVEEKIWNKNMVLGDVENAARHYVVYTDLMCPYCNYYAKTIQDNEEEFNQFISDHKIAYEVRVTDMLYESTSGVEYSRPAAEAAYCAAREGKFWDFYHKAIESIFKDYYSKGIGNSKTAPKISDLDKSYWKDLGEKAGLSDSFNSCFDKEETLNEVMENTYKAASVSAGLPYFVFGKYSTGGYDSSWGWEQTLQMLKSGL
ncbi:thioredoxin domain-containing protein [Candidatus Saccharibacteria bacterium]|nr:thioredoxin domain-containing protein [Candidatus Saccharibacteria bacterium]